MNSVAELLRRTISTVEITGDNVDFPARLVHEADGLPGFFLPVQDRAVGFQLRHQPRIGGQSGNIAEPDFQYSGLPAILPKVHRKPLLTMLSNPIAVEHTF